MRKGYWSPLLLFVLACSSGKGIALCPTASWQKLVMQHEDRYPGLGMPDVYKLLHQATMGSEHAAPSLSEATSWMKDEVTHLGIGPSEPLVDTLGETGRFVRIHLRPYLALGGTADSLVAAFVTTGQRFAPDTIDLKCALDSWQAMTGKDSLWNSDSVRAFIAVRAQSGYHAIEHSEMFLNTYHPAYRVVARDLLPLWRKGPY